MKDRIVITGGKTGGHFFPSLALAEELRKRGFEVYFLGVKGGIEEKIVPETSFKLFTLPGRGFEGFGSAGKLVSLNLALFSVFLSLKILLHIKPRFTVGFGGFSSVPVGLASHILGIPLYIHEQNAIPGKANLFLSRFSERIFLSFDRTRPFFPFKKTLVVGNLIRDSFLRDLEMAYRKDDFFYILILGGSQGALFLNKLALTLARLLPKNYYIFHQTGSRFYENMRKEYKNISLSCEVFPFHKNIGIFYKKAHLIISRAGASTVFEISASKRASILIPYPYAIYDHQFYNAKELERFGGARVFRERDLEASKVVEEIEFLRWNPNVRMEREERSGKLFKNNATSRMIEEMGYA